MSNQGPWEYRRVEIVVVYYAWDDMQGVYFSTEDLTELLRRRRRARTPFGPREPVGAYSVGRVKPAT
jgi:hypothetical protein